MADRLHVGMLEAQAAHEKPQKTGREKVAEHKRVDDLRMTYEGSVKMYNQQQEAMRATATLLALYADNPELKRIQAETAQRMQVMYETMVDRKLTYLQAETEMLGPEVQQGLEEDVLLSAVDKILKHQAINVQDEGIRKLHERVGRHADNNDAQRIKQEIQAARSKRLRETVQRRDYAVAVAGERQKLMGTPASSIGSAEMRAAMDIRIASEPQLDLMEELNEEVWRRENEDVLKNQYKESTKALGEARTSKQQILEFKKQQFAQSEQQAMAIARQSIE